MGADSFAENTPNAPEFICPICLPKPKSSGFNGKRLHWASVVRDQDRDISTATIHWVSSLVNKERPNNRVQRWLLSSE